MNAMTSLSLSASPARLVRDVDDTEIPRARSASTNGASDACRVCALPLAQLDRHARRRLHACRELARLRANAAARTTPAFGSSESLAERLVARVEAANVAALPLGVLAYALECVNASALERRLLAPLDADRRSLLVPYYWARLRALGLTLDANYTLTLRHGNDDEARRGASIEQLMFALHERRASIDALVLTRPPPASLAHAFPGLRSLSLDDVELDDDDAAASMTTALARLERLERLSLEHCALASLDAHVVDTCSRRLRSLNVARNELRALPDVALARLPALERLDARENRLECFPSALGTSPSLVFLSLQANRPRFDVNEFAARERADGVLVTARRLHCFV